MVSLSINVIGLLLMILSIISKGISVELPPYNAIQNPFLKARYPFGGYPLYPGAYPEPQGCPVCDSSVYGYCSHRLAHDSCCCRGADYYDDYNDCDGYTNCNFLYANTCHESYLIASCCCEDRYKSFNSLYTRLFKK